MRGLLAKDFCILKGQKNFFICILLLTVFLSLRSSDYFAVTYLTFLGGFLVISSISYDDNGNGVSFLMTLPVSRRLYVREKYVFSFLTTLFGWLAGVLITSVISLIQGAAPRWDDLLFHLVWVFAYMMFISIILPPTFKYGVEKGRMALLAIIVVLLAGIYAIAKALKSMGIDIDAMVEELSGFGTFALVAGVGVLAFVMALISYQVSGRIMQKKEF